MAASLSLRILLVDDDEGVQVAGEMLLGRLGHAVEVAWDGPQALEVLRRPGATFDLVITDQAMPGMSGLELAGEIRQLYPGVPVVLASGFLKEEDQRAVRESSVTAVLSKPFGLRELEELLETLR